MPVLQRDDLPAPVQETRRAIIEAAIACDYEALADLGSAGDKPFTFSFAPGDDPAAYWRDQEREGREVLAVLVELLSRSGGVRETPSFAQHVWPAASAYDRWDDVPDRHRDELAPRYGEAGLEAFAAAGTFTGYRAAIWSDGEWVLYVGWD